MQAKGIAARAGRWSTENRKKAIWGWLAFVVIAVVIGGSVGSKELSDADTYQGESGRAEHALVDTVDSKLGGDLGPAPVPLGTRPQHPSPSLVAGVTRAARVSTSSRAATSATCGWTSSCVGYRRTP